MRLRSLLLVGAVALGTTANAQGWLEDSVEMGAAYANDIFYSLKNSTVKAENSTNWHLAFQMTAFGEPAFNASVRANHIKGKVEVYPLHLAASSHFVSLAAADTVGKTSPSMQLINIDTTWGDGAFLQNRGTNLFDYGWGFYQGPPTHSVKGDSLYLLKVNNVPYKLWIKEYISIGASSIGYKFRIASFDNSSDDSFEVKKMNYSDRLYAYYDISTKTFIDREPPRSSWDLLFTQYPKYLIFGPSGLQAYTGVLTNQGVEVAELTNVDPDTVTAGTYGNYIPMMSKQINVIGDDWKTFSMTTFTYQIDTLKSWVIKAIKANNMQEYYQLKFTRFDGASGGQTGKIVFAKRAMVTLGVDEMVNNISAYSIYPNPASNEVNVMIDSKQSLTNAQIVITDILGKVAHRSTLKVNAGLNAFRVNTTSIPSGTYIVTVSHGAWRATEKLVVQH
jgi:hypothetical protein